MKNILFLSLACGNSSRKYFQRLLGSTVKDHVCAGPAKKLDSVANKSDVKIFRSLPALAYEISKHLTPNNRPGQN